MNRRESVKLMLGTAALASTAGLVDVAQAQDKPAAFTLPPLGYSYDALEPDIDTKTMQIHHDVHHGGYVKNLNSLAEKWPELATRPMEQILSNLSVVPENIRTAVRNNLGGHWNHTYFWEMMTPGGATSPTAELKTAIDGAFGDFDKMKAAVKRPAWLVSAPAGLGWPSKRQEADGLQHSQPGHAAYLQRRQADPRGRRLGARLLSEASSQARRVHRRLVEHFELGQGGGEFQESDGLSADLTAVLQTGRDNVPVLAAKARKAALDFTGSNISANGSTGTRYFKSFCRLSSEELISARECRRLCVCSYSFPCWRWALVPVANRRHCPRRGLAPTGNQSTPH